MNKPRNSQSELEQMKIQLEAMKTVLRLVVGLLRQGAPMVEPASWALLDPATGRGLPPEEAEVARLMQAEMRRLIGEETPGA